MSTPNNTRLSICIEPGCGTVERKFEKKFTPTFHGTPNLPNVVAVVVGVCNATVVVAAVVVVVADVVVMLLLLMLFLLSVFVMLMLRF